MVVGVKPKIRMLGLLLMYHHERHAIFSSRKQARRHHLLDGHDPWQSKHQEVRVQAQHIFWG